MLGKSQRRVALGHGWSVAAAAQSTLPQQGQAVASLGAGNTQCPASAGIQPMLECPTRRRRAVWASGDAHSLPADRLDSSKLAGHPRRPTVPEFVADSSRE